MIVITASQFVCRSMRDRPTGEDSSAQLLKFPQIGAIALAVDLQQRILLRIADQDLREAGLSKSWNHTAQHLSNATCELPRRPLINCRMDPAFVLRMIHHHLQLDCCDRNGARCLFLFEGDVGHDHAFHFVLNSAPFIALTHEQMSAFG